MLLLFTTSAQTHIFPEIRINSVRLLDILLECIPDAVTAGWSEDIESHGSRVLGGYLGILNAGTKYGETVGGFIDFFPNSHSKEHILITFYRVSNSDVNG